MKNPDKPSIEERLDAIEVRIEKLEEILAKRERKKPK